MKQRTANICIASAFAAFASIMVIPYYAVKEDLRIIVISKHSELTGTALAPASGEVYLTETQAGTFNTLSNIYETLEPGKIYDATVRGAKFPGRVIVAAQEVTTAPSP